MKKSETIRCLKNILKGNKFLTKHQRLAIRDAIQKLQKAKTWEQCIKVADILSKLIYVGSNFF